MAKKISDENGNTNVQKKPFYKRVWFWIVAVILVIIVGSSMGGSKDSKSSSSSSSNSSSNVSNNSSKVSKANFDKITVSDTDGTSTADVESLFGKKASSTSTQTIENTESKMYTWDKVKDGDMLSNVVIGFSSDHAISKSITGLKVKRDNKIALADFNSITNGMTKVDVEKKFGKPNGYDLTNLAGYNSEIWMYTSDVKGDAGANFNITFTDDQVSGQTQTSMK